MIKTGCDHKFKKHKNFDCQICACGAISGYDDIRDPLHQGGIVILKPSRDDWAELSHRERSLWFEENKQRLLGDVKKYGYSLARKKWEIAGGTWTNLMVRWGIALVGETKPKYQVGKFMPQLPDFSNDWPESVQLKWLEIYEKLIGN